MDKINLAPPSEESELPKINLNTAGDFPYVSEDTATSLAERVKAAGVLQDKAMEDIRDGILQGKEKLLRSEAASSVNLETIQNRNDKIQKAIQNYQGTLDLPAYNKIVKDIDTWDVPHDIDPGYAFEHVAAKYAMNLWKTSSIMNDGDISNSMRSAPEVVQQATIVGTDLTTKYQVLDRLQRDARDTVSQQGWGSYLLDQAKSVVPFVGQLYSETKLRGNVPGVGKFEGGFTLGSQLEEEGKRLFRLPVGEFTKVVTARYEALKKDNPSIAESWLSAMKGQSTIEKILNDAFTLSIPADIATAGGLLFRAGAKTADTIAVKSAVRDVVKAAATSTGKDLTTEVIAATGDIGSASVAKGAGRILQDFKGSSKPVEAALEALPSGLKQDIVDIKSKPSQLGTGLTNMLVELYDRSIGRLTEVALNSAKVSRIPFEQITVSQLKELKETVKSQYPGLSNAILDISNPTLNKVSNTWYMDIAVGKPGAELWGSKSQAQLYAKAKGLTDYTLDNQGGRWFLRISRNIDEETGILQDLAVNKEKGVSKQSTVNSLLRLGYLRTPDDVISENARVNRKVAQYSQARLTAMANEERVFIEDVKKGRIRFDPVTGEEIPWYKRVPANVYNRLESAVTRRGKTQWDRLERTLKDNQTMPDPDIPEARGMYFKTEADLQDYYLRNFKQLPTPEESMAYFANKRLVEYDRALRNIGVYRNKARLGAKSYSIATTNAQGIKGVSESFDGMQQFHLPGGDDTVLVMGKTINEQKLYNFGEGKNISDKQLEKLREDIKTGKYKVIRIYDPEQRPLKGFGTIENQRIRYVITPNVEESALSWNQVPRRGGGHIEYDYEHYIKQANIRSERVGKKFTNWYEGDTTVMPIQLKSMGIEAADKLNTVRLMLKKKDVSGARAFTEKNLPIEFEEIQKWFKSGRLSYDEPFVVVPKNRSIGDISDALEKRYSYTDEKGNTKTTFKDGTRSGSDARQFQIEYTGSRDAYDMFTFKDVGTKGNPIFQKIEAETLDPLPVMNRAVSKIINSSTMDDIKISQMEQWIREHASVLKASESELKSAPFYHFNNPVYRTGADAAAVSQAKITNLSLRQFVGMPSKTDTFIHSVVNSMSEWAYKSGGPQREALVPHWLIPYIKDPVSYIRAMAYHAKLGLFAWPQLFVQSQTFVNIAALSPRSSAAGTYGAFLHQWSRLNPAMLETLDKYATKISIPGFHSFKPGEFKEAHKLLDQTGFGTVGAEYVDLNSLSNFRTVRNSGKEFLDLGQIFFKESEQNVRYGAWYTAYKEYRVANPLGKITEAERAKILDRADLLYTNMSRASASQLHTGVFSLTSQFMSYQMRLAELFMSKRLGATATERALTRARMLTANGLMYGLPVGLGVTGLPVADYIRTKATENGYVVGDKFLSSAIMEGVPAMLAALSTGEGDVFDVPERLRSGNWYDVGPRYGSNGFDQIRQALNGDKSLWEVLGGPGLSTAGKMITGGSSFLKGTVEMIKAVAGGKDSEFPLKWQDLMDPLNQVASVSALRRHIYMLNTGKLISNTETQMSKPGEISAANAWFMTTFGLQPQSARDVYTKEGILKEQHEMQKDALKSFIKEMHRSLDSADVKDYEQARDYRTRALAHLVAAGYPQEKMASAISQAFSGRYSSLVDQIDWDLYFKYAPEDKKDVFLQTYKTILNNQDKRMSK